MTRVFTIPPDQGFLSSLVRAVLGGGFPDAGRPPPGALDLARWTFLVPTRRAARMLQRAFLAAGPEAARLLPTIRPLGDADEDLFETGDGDALDLPPAITAEGRDFLLVRLIRQWAHERQQDALAREVAASPGQTLALAQSLGLLADRFETGDVPFDALALLTGRELAAHRETLLGLLDILQRGLPEALMARGQMGPAERRSRAMHLAAERLQRRPPPGPVIAAGSTGTIPASAHLIAAIARLPEGAAVLPGLDREMDAASWEAVSDSHPQMGMKQLLHLMEVKREDVAQLPGLKRSDRGRARAWLAGEIMRPAEASEGWRAAVAEAPPAVAEMLGNLTTVEAQSQGEEATLIALMLRATLEQPESTAALVTPNRTLARKVKTELLRWGVEADDSAGEPLALSLEAVLVRLLSEIEGSVVAPVTAAALLGHPLVTCGMPAPQARQAARHYELAVIRRGFAIAPGFAAAAALARQGIAEDPHLHPAVKRLSGGDWDALASFAAAIDTALKPLMKRPAQSHFAALIQTAEALGAERMWSRDAGAEVLRLLTLLAEEAAILGPISGREAAAYLDAYLAQTPLRKPFTGRERVTIYGLLEARLVEADLIVLGGLTAKSWPPEPDPGPWLNRPMREALGLQQPERQIGLSAHDFAQGFAKPGSVLTWCRRAAGEPVVPSRFVLRLQAVAEAAGVQLPASPWLAWTRQLDTPDHIRPEPMPMPAPPLAARPRRFSVSDVELLIRDPYAIYAKRILGLEPLDRLNAELDARLRGELIHAALQRYMERHPTASPADPLAELLAIGRGIFAPHLADPDVAAFWWPRFERIARWFAENDPLMRDGVGRIATEAKGRIDFPIAGDTYTLTARADRIDLKSGSARIVDYKTGAAITAKDVEAGLSPQLTLEAAILAAGGFKGLPALDTGELIYMYLSGGEPAGEIKPAGAKTSDPMALAANHLDGLKRLLLAYSNPAQGYMPRAALRPDRASPYDRVSRHAEWSQGQAEDPA